MPTHRAPTLFAICLLALLLGFYLLCPVKSQAAVLPDGSYLIQMSDSDMTVAPSTNAVSARVTLWPYKPSATWDFHHLGNDIYRITSGKLVLDSYESIKKVGVPIIVFPWHGNGNQRWKVKRIGRCYSLINVTTGLAMELKDNKRVNSTHFHGNEPNGSPGQLFRLFDKQGKNPADSSPPAGSKKAKASEAQASSSEEPLDLSQTVDAP